MDAIAASHKKLLDTWNKTPRNLDDVDKSIKTVKADVQTAPAAKDVKTAEALMCVSKDLNEITALLAVLKSDMVMFEDAINEVLAFYHMAPPKLQENKYLMTGLNLMYLLASNRLSDFHMLLEKVPHMEQVNNIYISTPVRLEQSLMEGAYNKVVLTEKTIPSPYYATFIQTMIDAVKREIATSMEKSFKELHVKDAVAMLLATDVQGLAGIIKERGWKLDKDSQTVSFTGPVPMEQDRPTALTTTMLDTTRIATQTIFYAKQLEQIV